MNTFRVIWVFIYIWYLSDWREQSTVHITAESPGNAVDCEHIQQATITGEQAR
jgi:hypothetical protein